mmetsp:Transcript_26345/g.23296  ORF Transcript_26345/g.23296 Transcript_26345/m.23296 type:complete len:84 (-) Transcript_26345:714-965(-)
METTGENTIIDSSTLLPPEPTLEEAGSEEILALMFKAREKFCEAMSILSEDGWTTIKGKFKYSNRIQREKVHLLNKRRVLKEE